MDHRSAPTMCRCASIFTSIFGNGNQQIAELWQICICSSYAVCPHDVCVITDNIMCAQLLRGLPQLTRKLSLAVLPHSVTHSVLHAAFRLASCSNFNYSICRHLNRAKLRDGRRDGGVNVAFMHYIITVVFALRQPTSGDRCLGYFPLMMSYCLDEFRGCLMYN